MSNYVDLFPGWGGHGERELRNAGRICKCLPLSSTLVFEKKFDCLAVYNQAVRLFLPILKKTTASKPVSAKLLPPAVTAPLELFAAPAWAGLFPPNLLIVGSGCPWSGSGFGNER